MHKQKQNISAISVYLKSLRFNSVAHWPALLRCNGRVMRVSGCQLDTDALMQVCPLLCLLYNLSQPPWPLNAG